MSDHQYLNENAHLKARKPGNNTPDAAPEVNDLVRLQGVVGNQGVQRLLAQRKLVIQPKLNVTAAGDQYEQEADTVAKQVVQQMNAPQTAQREEGGEAEEEELSMKRDLVQREDDGDEAEDEELSMKRDIVQREEGGEAEEEELSMKRDLVQREGESKKRKWEGGEEEEEPPTKQIRRATEEDGLAMQRIQREDDGDEAEDEELSMKRIQRQSFENGGEVDSDIESSIESSRGGGQAIEDGVRGKLEGAFGADFSGVRVHTDSQSDSLNKSIQAKAFTTGSDIFFSKGAYNPNSSDGQELLSHELTHVVQQNGSVQKKQEE
jgi:hypothetical protein